MRLFAYRNSDGSESVGAMIKASANEFVNLCATDSQIPNNLLSIIADEELLGRVKTALDNSRAICGNTSSISFKPPIEKPGKIVCMGLNYADHAKEGGNARPEYPSFFMRGPSSLTSHLGPIIKPRVSDKLDYEAELAFIVGKKVRHLTLDTALDCVAGYSIFNDGSIRDYQRDRKSTRLNSSHSQQSRMPSSA